MKENKRLGLKFLGRHFFVFFLFLGIMSTMHVYAAEVPSNLLSQIKPYHSNRYETGKVSMAGQTYQDCLLFDSYNSITAKASFYLEGKYSSLSFCVGHVNGSQTRTVTVYCDGRSVWSEKILADDLPHSANINLSGVQVMKIVVSGSSGSFTTAVADMNLVSNGYTREERMKPVTSNFLTNVQAYNSKRYETGSRVMGDKNFEDALAFNSFNNVTAYAAYNLQGDYKTMSFYVGNETNTKSNQKRTVTITGDGTQLYSRTLSEEDAPVHASISVAGVHQLKIEVSGSPASYNVVLGGVNLTSNGVVRGISLDQESMKLSANNPSAYLKATIIPSDASNLNVIWSSSDENVATVSSNGLVTAVDDGSATITAATAQGGYTASCEVTVTGMSVDLKKATIKVANGIYSGSAVKPEVTVSYNGRSLRNNVDYKVSYSKNIDAGTAEAVISGKGRYKGTVTKTFTIEKAEQELTVDVSAQTLVVGKTAALTAKGTGQITFSSSNKKIAAVSQKGKITAKTPGTVRITVDAAGNANYKAAKESITLTVNPKKTTIKTAKNTGKRKATVKWKKISGVTGYQIKYVTGSKIKTVSAKGASATSKRIQNLRKNKTYKIYVRTYKTVSGKNYYSSWSKVKSVKITK